MRSRKTTFGKPSESSEKWEPLKKKSALMLFCLCLNSTLATEITIVQSERMGFKKCTLFTKQLKKRLFYMKKNLFTLLFMVLATSLTFLACGEKNQDSEIDILKREVLKDYATLVRLNYEDAYSGALNMKMRLGSFMANTNEGTLALLRNEWLAARNAYGQTEAFRFYAGPIDDADGLEGLINAWPMDESFVDYVVGFPDAGVINNPASIPDITREKLVGLHEIQSEVTIFTGWHTIEFLLWGQDLSTTGPGTRPATDYVVGPGGTAAHQDRRRQYLEVVTDLLVDHLAEVRDEWTSGSPYPQEFLNEKNSDEALGLLFTSFRDFTITELAGERMFVAIDTKEQEHEHSCFSDNTIADLKMNLLGIKNVYYGQYTKTDGFTFQGKSIHDLVVKVDAAKDLAVEQAFAAAEQAFNNIPAPFDQTIVNNPAPVQLAITAVENLGNQLVEAGRAVGATF